MFLLVLFYSLVASAASSIDTDSETSFLFEDLDDMTVDSQILPPDEIRIKPPRRSSGKKPTKEQEDFVPEAFNPYPSPDEINTFLDPSKGFNFTVNCWGVDSTVCLSAKSALESTGHLIASDIKFRKPINVYVSFSRSTIFKPSICVKSTAIYPAIKVGESKELSYPQSLLKQSYVPNEVVYKAFDMVMEIQPSRFWNFNVTATEVGMIKFDFACICSINLVAAARELTRGLGFGSKLIQVDKGLLGTQMNEFPVIDGNGNLTRIIQRPFIFDSLLYSGMQSIGLLANNYSSYQCPANLDREHFLDLLKSGPSITSKEMFNVMTSKTLESRGARGAVLLMKTCPGYQRVSDLADNYWDSAEFLMTAKPPRGITLREKVGLEGIYSIYGPSTLEVLEAIGYATELNPQMLEFEQVSRYY